MFDGNWRESVNKGLDPVGVSLRRAGVSADALTILGIVFASIAAVVIGNGYLRLGLLFLCLTGIPDALDGAVAKASGTASVRGAFFDSVSDRLTDILLFSGLTWYLMSNEGRIALLPVAIMGAAMLISYQRAKAESLGFDAKGGIMERAERFIVLGFALLFNELLIPILWVMLVLTIITAIQRFVKVWRQATNVMPNPPASVLRRQQRVRRRAEARAQRQPRRRA